MSCYVLLIRLLRAAAISLSDRCRFTFLPCAVLHLLVLHIRTVIRLPTQCWPPCAGEGLVQLRLAYVNPPPHVAVHADHSDHSDHPLSTPAGTKYRQVISNTVKALLSHRGGEGGGGLFSFRP